MNTPPRRSSTPRNLGVLAIVVLGAYFLPNLLNHITDRLFFPWALARPPLIDRWAGQLTTGNGDRLVVAMTLERDLTDGGRICIRCGQLRGSASTCDDRRSFRRYRVSGSPTNREGRVIRLGASPVAQPSPDGVELSTLDGRWDGGDALELQADFIWRRSGAAGGSTNDPATQPVPLRMERQSHMDLDDVCDALGLAQTPARR